jgi:hypothetical protein
MKKLFDFFRKKSYFQLEKRSIDAINSLDFFYSKKIWEDLKLKGFSVVDLLNEEELLQIKSDLNSFLLHVELKNLFYTSGRDNKEIMNLARLSSMNLVQSKLENVIDVSKAKIEGGAWLIKPFGDQSGLSPHQDSSMVNEISFSMCYGWIPIQEVNKKNGCVHVIPGSHLFGNHFRSLDVPWMFEKYKDVLLEYSIPIEMKAGQLLLFDSALIHGSYINETEELRTAINFLCLNKEVDYVHYMQDDNTPKGKIESYKVNMDFFFLEDYRKKPDTNKYSFLGYVDEIKCNLDEKSLRNFLNEHKINIQ